MTTRTRASARPRPRARLHPDHYFVCSQEPLQSLIYLTPLLLLYELGTLVYAMDPMGRRVSIRARSFLLDFLQTFGAAGDYLPGLALVVVLLCLHIARRDKWRFEPRVYVGMFFESVALAIPLLMFGLVFSPRRAGAIVIAAAGAVSGGAGVLHHTWQMDCVLSLGAGIYEDFVFRLVAIAVLHLLFVDVLGMPQGRGAVLSIVCSAVLFSAYHFSDRAFAWPLFMFYFAAGVYFAVIYVIRGFGIAAATHAFYDILIFTILHGFLPAR